MSTVEIDTINLGSQELRYALVGPKNADRTLLVFNGIGASLDAVVPFAKFFKRTRLITFDVPGVGGSSTPALPYRFSTISRMARRLLDKLGIGEVDVFGVSWGGALAQQFVYDNPSRCRSMTLAATSAGFVMVPGNISALMKMATPKRYLDPEHMQKIGPDIYGGQLRMNRTLLLEHADALKAGTKRGYIYQLLAGMGWTSWLWLPKITAPTLIMMGEDDPLVPVVNGEMLRKRLPNAKLMTVECGHLFILSQPEATATAIEDFIHASDMPVAEEIPDGEPGFAL